MKDKSRTLLALLFMFSVLINIYFFTRVWWESRYDEDGFNCVGMSYSLAPLFHGLGLDTRVVYGSNNESAHCWLSLNGLYFDATTLWFNSESEYRVDFVDRYPYGYWDELREVGD
jgi:hypothetical protein